MIGLCIMVRNLLKLGGEFSDLGIGGFGWK